MKRILQASLLLLLCMSFLGCNTINNLPLFINTLQEQQSTTESNHFVTKDKAPQSITSVKENTEETEENTISPDEQNVLDTVVTFFSSLIKGDLDATQSLLTKEYAYLDRNLFEITDLDVLKSCFSRFQVTYKDIDIKDNLAIMKLSVIHPYFDDLYSLLQKEYDINETDFIRSWLEENKDETDNSIAYIVLQKQDNTWKILSDYDQFDRLVSEGDTDKLSIDTVTEYLKMESEMKNYIKDFISIDSYNLKNCKDNGTSKPSLYQLCVKNTGDQILSEITIRIEFHSEDGTVLQTKEVPVLNYTDEPLYAGDSLTINSNNYIVLDNLFSGINLSKNKVTISHVAFLDTEKMSEEALYIFNHLKILDYYIGYCDTYTEPELGLSNLKIENSGDRTISQLAISLYYLNSSGDVIYEDTYLVCDMRFQTLSFPPGITSPLPYLYYYKLYELWENQSLRYKIKIADIRFE